MKIYIYTDPGKLWEFLEFIQLSLPLDLIRQVNIGAKLDQLLAPAQMFSISPIYNPHLLIKPYIYLLIKPNVYLLIKPNINLLIKNNITLLIKPNIYLLIKPNIYLQIKPNIYLLIK